MSMKPATVKLEVLEKKYCQIFSQRSLGSGVSLYHNYCNLLSHLLSCFPMTNAQFNVHVIITLPCHAKVLI